MPATAQSLLDAHTRHLLQQLSGPGLQALLDDETSALWQWLAARPAAALTDEVRVRDFLLRNVLEQEPSPRLLAQIGTLASHALSSPLTQQVKLEELLNGREYDLVVDRLIALEKLRHELVHAALQNPAVTQLISDLVYNGVKNYLAENSGLAKKVPGMSSLMKVGKGVMERVGADDAIDGALRSYIKRNTRSTMEMCERLLTSALETPKLKTISRQFWQQIKSMPLSRLSRHVQADDVDDVVTIGNTLWNHFRQTGYARDLLGELVHVWFNEHGQEPLTQVLESLGLSEERLKEEVRQIGLPLVAELVASGHLEARLRAHLGRFYLSPEVSALLAS